MYLIFNFNEIVHLLFNVSKISNDSYNKDRRECFFKPFNTLLNVCDPT